MFDRKIFFDYFPSCILMEVVEPSVGTAGSQLRFCEAEHITKKLWASSLTSCKLVLALTFDLSSLHNTAGVPTGDTSSGAAVGAGTSLGAAAGVSAVGTGSRPRPESPVGPEALGMLPKPERRPRVWPGGPADWALPKRWGSHATGVSKGQTTGHVVIVTLSQREG